MKRRALVFGMVFAGTMGLTAVTVISQQQKQRRADDRIGKWHDGPRDMVVWYVCEKADLGGCSEAGWSAFEGSCYAFSEGVKSYDDAAAACAAQRAQLVSIQSAEENAYVQSLCKRRSCWLGLSEPADSENWFWADGVAAGTKGKWVGYVNWEKGEPNNYGGRDEEATFMNPPPDLKAMMEPGAFHAHLKPLAGHWAAVMRTRGAPDHPWKEMKATLDRKWILDGRFLVEEFKGELREGGSFQGYGMSGYDNLKKKYVSVWANNVGTGFINVEGTCDASGKVITYHAETSDPMSGQTKTMKMVLRIINNNKNVTEGYVTTPDGKEFKNWEAIYTRK